MHFIGVGVSAVMASVAALALTIVGVRRHDGRVVLVGTAFTVMAALLAIHGLATPGVVIGDNGVISLTGARLCRSAAPSSPSPRSPGFRRPQGIRSLLVLQVVSLVGVLGLGIVGMAVPSSSRRYPNPQARRQSSLSLSASFFYGLLSCGR